MKIGVAQIRPVKGDIQANIDRHKKLIDLACSYATDVIVFPELSITGYEPGLSHELATHKDDTRFDDFQLISDTKKITIGIGVPTKDSKGICITMLLFQPEQARQTYSKKYLHPDEEPYFISGDNSNGLIGNKSDIALAICYELSVPEHAENVHQHGAQIYLTSVAKTAEGVKNASSRLSEIAKHYSMMALMANCIGLCDGMECAGKSSIWNSEGLLIEQLNDSNEGILILNTETQEVISKIHI